MLPLFTLPHPILRQVTKEVPLPLAAELPELVKQMYQAMEHYHGIGLAAPQIGQNLRLMVMVTSDGPRGFINPKIIKSSWGKEDFEEGCLSIPGVFGIVRRPKRIYVSYTTPTGTLETGWYEGLSARVYQHEVDHLNGVLFIDRTKKITAGRELLTNYARA